MGIVLLEMGSGGGIVGSDEGLCRCRYAVVSVGWMLGKGTVNKVEV